MPVHMLSRLFETMFCLILSFSKLVTLLQNCSIFSHIFFFQKHHSICKWLTDFCKLLIWVWWMCQSKFGSSTHHLFQDWLIKDYCQYNIFYGNMIIKNKIINIRYYIFQGETCISNDWFFCLLMQWLFLCLYQHNL